VSTSSVDVECVVVEPRDASVDVARVASRLTRVARASTSSVSFHFGPAWREPRRRALRCLAPGDESVDVERVVARARVTRASTSSASCLSGDVERASATDCA
jgi:hypothetical protein